MDLDQYPEICIADNDGIYGKWLNPLMKEYFDTQVIRTPVRCPWWNGKVERFNRSLKEEAFLNVIPISIDQIQRICLEYKRYYNHHRCHQGLGGETPARAKMIKTDRYKQEINYQKVVHLGGKITSFEPMFDITA